MLPTQFFHRLRVAMLVIGGKAASEAEGTSAKYFESPPQLARFLNGTHRRILPLHPVDKQDWAGLVEYLDCKPTNPSPSVDAST